MEFNGRSYACADDMPTAERALFESIMAVAARRGGVRDGAREASAENASLPTGYAPLRVEPIFSRYRIAVAVGLAALLVAATAIAFSR